MEEVKSHEASSYLNCRKCVEYWELTDKRESPRDYARLEIAINIDNQLLIGCVRHNEHVGAFTLHEQVNMQAMSRGCDCCE